MKILFSVDFGKCPAPWAMVQIHGEGLTLTILVMISDVEMPSVLSVAQNISFDFGSAYVSKNIRNYT